MSDYILHNGELMHYGVLGMKWGVTKNPSRAYNKAVKKRNKMEDKRLRLQEKSDKILYKSSKKLARSITTIGKTQAQNGLVKGHKIANKASKLAIKERKWEKAMDKEFADMSITKLSEKEIAAGNKFIDNILYGNEQYRVEKREK